jgi:hypothetical protein
MEQVQANLAVPRIAPIDYVNNCFIAVECLDTWQEASIYLRAVEHELVRCYATFKKEQDLQNLHNWHLTLLNFQEERAAAGEDPGYPPLDLPDLPGYKREQDFSFDMALFEQWERTGEAPPGPKALARVAKELNLDEKYEESKKDRETFDEKNPPKDWPFITALELKKQELAKLAAEQASMPDFAKNRCQEDIVKSTTGGTPSPKSPVVVASKIPVAKSRPITERPPIPLRTRTKPQDLETPQNVRFEEKPLPSLPAEQSEPRFMKKTAASKAREEITPGTVKSSAASIRSVRTIRDAPFSPEDVFSPIGHHSGTVKSSAASIRSVRTIRGNPFAPKDSPRPMGYRKSPSKATLRDLDYSTPSKSTGHGKLQLNRTPSKASMMSVRSNSQVKSPTKDTVDKLGSFFKKGSDKTDEPGLEG